jgi:hypothetical protein
MNAPFSPDKQPLLSLDSGVLGDKFKELSKLPGFSQHYGDLARESLETFQARMDLASVDFSNYELAVTQLDGLRDFEWGGLDFIVRLYMPLHVRDGIKMPKKQLEASLDIACDEKTIKGHKKLIRRFLEGPSAKKVSLQELANDYFNPKSQEKKIAIIATSFAMTFSRIWRTLVCGSGLRTRKCRRERKPVSMRVSRSLPVQF